MYCVYVHIFPNEKKYFGITKLKPEYRWNNGKGYKKQKLVYDAIKKYGWDNIKHKILFENLSEKEAKNKEKELIKKYKTNDAKYGYNITEGGDGASGVKLSQHVIDILIKANKGKHRSEETKRKISESSKGRIVLKESIEKRKKTMERRYPNGYKFSEESKKKMSERMKGNKYNLGKNNNKKYIEKISIKVICVETGEVFKSIIEASREKNINKANLHYAVKGKRETAGGYHWKEID